MDAGLISIIVPVYNAEAYLTRCIDSLCGQTYRNLEIILVDDGSKDASGAICDRYAEQDKRIRVIHQPNSGVSAARNRALSVAHGKYIGFADSDDYVAADMYEKLLTAMLQNDCDVTVCDFEFVYDDGSRKSNCRRNNQFLCDRKAAIQNLLRGRYFAGHLWNKLFKAELLQGLTFDPEVKIYEDALFVVEALIRSKQLFYTSEPLYGYVIHADSAYNRPFTESHLTAFTACRQIGALLKENHLGLEDEAYAADLGYAALKLYEIYKQNSGMEYAEILKRRIRQNFTFKRLFCIETLKKKGLVLLCYINPNLLKIFLKR